jgi:SNF2 domain-containing protein/SNF2 helicase protein/helicase-like protein
MPLVYLPDARALFLWGAGAELRELAGLVRSGTAQSVELVTPEGRREVSGVTLPLLDALSALAVLPTAQLAALPASVSSWALASKLAMDLVARERIVPALEHAPEGMIARWAAALSSSEDAAKVAALARSLPPAAHAVPAVNAELRASDASAASSDVWAPEALLRTYLDAAIDALVRSTRGSEPLAKRAKSEGGRLLPWAQRWRAALAGSDRAFEPTGFAERSLAADLQRWSAPALGRNDRLRACFRLELPEAEPDLFRLRFMLQSPDDLSLLVPASEIWRASGQTLLRFGRAFEHPQEALLEALGRAAILFPPIATALATRTPEAIELDPSAAWAFLGDGAAALSEAGFGVIVPGELTTRGARRLRLRMRVTGKQKVAGAVSGAAALGLDELLVVDYQAALGDETIGASELAELARQKAPLVRFRGAWVAIDPTELAEIRKRMAGGPTSISLGEAVRAALAGESRQGQLSAVVSPAGSFAELLERLRGGASTDRPPPAGLRATLRPYQQRGQSWLQGMAELGLGACLADDMGLGKTIQLIAHLLRCAERSNGAGPALLVAPTSVIGNFERELERFAPDLVVVRHYGAGRARSASELAGGPRNVVLTSYGLLRRDVELLERVEWSTVALDEAQNIKNAAAATTRAARALRARQRFALTGTPVENRLAELWSILDFVNPGLLGPLEAFRREFAIPIERYGSDAAASRLRRVTSPFILRRLKSDPTVIADLPAKNEMKVVCTLTREQATLYKAVVDEELRRIEQAEGIERRGRVLALLTATKQICNHPAQYLSEAGPLPRRSGKLSRLTEMLEEALSAGDKALVFTQFREMGERLVAHLEAALGSGVSFLHGGTSKKARDELVRSFQEDARGARVFVLSLKAGGTGLNLTAANHVFHYDRWWNPAVEDQATDRAYRIGQKRAVQVHKLVCAGTVEDKIDRLLELKRGLASKVVGAGERWITELDGGELRELFTLSATAAVADGDEEAAVGAPAAAPKRAARATRREPRA